MSTLEVLEPFTTPSEYFGQIFDIETDLQDPEMQQKVLELRSLLRQQDFPYARKDFPKADCDHWDINDYLQYGRTLHYLAYDKEEKQGPLTSEIVTRAYILGLGPPRSRIQEPSRFQSLWRFNEALELQPTYARGRYDHWQIDHLSAFCAHLVDLNQGHKPTKELIQKVHEDGDGPSLSWLEERCHGLGKFYELSGFPNVKRWQLNDYIQWGAEVLASGTTARLSAHFLNHLSREGRGPSQQTITTKFGSLPSFQNAVYQRLSKLGPSPETRFATHTYVLEGEEEATRLIHNVEFSTLANIQTGETHILSPQASLVLKYLAENGSTAGTLTELEEAFPTYPWDPDTVTNTWGELTNIEALTFQPLHSGAGDSPHKQYFPYNLESSNNYTINTYVLFDGEKDVELAHNIDWRTITNLQSGKVHRLSPQASSLLVELSKHVDAPTTIDDLRENYPEELWDKPTISKALQELSTVEALRGHIFHLALPHGRRHEIYSLLQRSEDIGRLYQRLEYMHEHLYGDTPDTSERKRNHHVLLKRLGVVAATASAAAIAGGTILKIIRHRKGK